MDYDLGAEVDPAGKAEDISIEQAQKTESAIAVYFSVELQIVEKAAAKSFYLAMGQLRQLRLHLRPHKLLQLQ